MVSGQSNSGGSDTQNFCYDTENRLIWAGNQGTQPAAGNGTCGSGTLANTLSGASYSGSYVYTNLGQQWQGPIDGNGQQQQSLYCDSSHPHQLQGLYPIGTTCATSGTTTANYSLSYDSWGNVTSRTYAGVAATLSYDVSDHLVQWSGTNTTTQQSTGQQWSVYDASGQRVLQRSTLQYDIPLTVYAFGADEHDYTATGQGSNNLYYYSLGGRLIGIMYSSETDALLTDAEGSVLSRLTTTAGSAIVKGNQVYSPYGSKLYSSGSMATTRGFTGQYKDATGLNYYNARYYDSVAGRFISADTVQGNAQGMDPYAYVHGNPETLTDPTGQVSHCHEPGDCGSGSYTTNVSGGDTGGGGGAVVGQDGSPCTGLCDGPYRQPPQLNSSSYNYNQNYRPSSGRYGNPKIVRPTATPVPTTTCNDRCRADKELIKSHLRDQQDTYNNFSTLIGDIIALGADIVAAVAEIAARQVKGAILEIASVLMRAGVVVGDMAKLGIIFHMPPWISDVLQTLKVVAGVIDAVGAWFNFLDFGALINKGVQSVAAAVTPKLIAFILSVANVGVLTGTIGVPKGADAFYWAHQRDIVDGYNDAQALSVCVQDHASHPGMC